VPPVPAGLSESNAEVRLRVRRSTWSPRSDRLSPSPGGPHDEQRERHERRREAPDGVHAASYRGQGFSLTHLVVGEDVAQTSPFSADELGGEVVFQAPSAPTMVEPANTWLIVAERSGGTPDKPNATMGPPTARNRYHAFTKAWVADIQAIYEAWSSNGDL